MTNQLFSGFVLTGGKSSRMGTNKAALRLGEATFAERAARALESIAATPICFVISESQIAEATDFLPPNAVWINDVSPGKAALGAVYTALTAAENEWAAIMACDYPFVTNELFIRLAEIANSVDNSISAVVPVQPDGRLQPLCALYRVEPCLAAAARLVTGEQVLPMRSLPQNVKTRRVGFEELTDLPGANLFFENINTAQDYLRIQAIYNDCASQ